MSMVEFAEATRVATNPLAGLERRCLVWMAGRLPRWVTSDRLTALALAAMALTGISYAAGPSHPGALLLAIVGLGLNWFGDSLDERSRGSGGNSALATVFMSTTSSTVSGCSSCWRASAGPAT